MKNPKAALLLEYLSKAPNGLSVEIGCIREDHEVVEDGFSTPYLAAACESSGREFLSFDVDQGNVSIANRVLESRGLKPIVRCQDGLEAIKSLGPISFLFLDGHRHPKYTVDQYMAAELVPGAVVIIDDCQPIDSFVFGKAQFVKFLLDSYKTPYDIVETANNGMYQWKSLCTILKNGKQRGKLK